MLSGTGLGIDLTWGLSVGAQAFTSGGITLGILVYGSCLLGALTCINPSIPAQPPICSPFGFVVVDVVGPRAKMIERDEGISNTVAPTHILRYLALN